jgi:glycolate oxidase FAD binding subunit
VEYVPGDLTLTARAGTTLAEIRDVTASHNQWLALDPHGSDEGTLGATVSTASSGPLATYFGTPRDLTLGIEFVTGTGTVARGGGRVVKNVAGFDLTRLLTGSWGTLGVITEVTVRLHARPAVDASFAVRIEESDAARVRTILRRLPFLPYACEIVNAALGRELLGTVSTAALFRLAGNREGVDAQRGALAELGPLTEVDTAVWTKLRAVERKDSIVFRLSSLPSEIAGTWSEGVSVEGAMVHAAPMRGVVRVIAPAAAENSVARLFARSTHATRSSMAGERLSAALWAACPIPADGAELSARVKATFDPSRILNPGILGDTA